MQTEYLLEAQDEMFKYAAGRTLIAGFFNVFRCLLLPQNTENEVKVQVWANGIVMEAVLCSADTDRMISTAQQCTVL
jgi:hypothetical protein